MQVKDYLQALVDDDKIRVEKIGSGNWYWSFAGQEKRNLETQLARAEAEKQKAVVEAEAVKAKIDEAVRAQEDDEDVLEGDGMDKKAVMEMKERLSKEVEELRKELNAYRDSDPQVLGEKKQELIHLKSAAMRITDNIYVYEAKVKEVYYDRDMLDRQKMDWYGVEYDDDEAGLKDLPA